MNRIRRRCLRIVLALVGVIGTVGPFASSVVFAWQIGIVFERTIGVAAGLLFCFHVVNSTIRFCLKHWSRPQLQPFLRREIVFGCGLPATIAAAAFLLPPTWPVLLILGFVLLFQWGCYDTLEREIHRLVEADEKLVHGTEFFGRWKPLRWLLAVPADVDELAKGDRGTGAEKLFGTWVKPGWKAGMSRARTVIVYAFLICSLLAFTASAQTALRESAEPQGGDTEKTDESGGSSGGEAETPLAGAPAMPSAPGDVGDLWEDERTCRFAPARRAPKWAGQILNALYYGGLSLNANPPPGTIGGCTRMARMIATPSGAFIYTIGWSASGEVRSVAAVSEAFEPAIFLAPAARHVLALIRRGVVPLGGYPTVKPAGGDAVAITTQQGTFMLIRTATHPPGMPKFAEPYVELAPAAASAWLGTVKEAGTWLWPSTPRPSAHGLAFDLRGASMGDEALYTVYFDPDTGTAWRDEYRYDLPEPPLGEGELRQYARTAR